MHFFMSGLGCHKFYRSSIARGFNIIDQDINRRLEVAKDLALKAGSSLMSFFGKSFDCMQKGDSSLVTEADLASEHIILTGIQSVFPDDQIISEEQEVVPKLLEGRFVWVVDPLDGTTNFANRYPFFCVSIGVGIVKGGKIDVQVGVIGDPVRKDLYHARLGFGAELNGSKIAVRQPRPFAESFLVTGFYYNVGSQLESGVDLFKKVALSCQSIRRDGAAALDLAFVAKGVFDAFWEDGLKPWDMAAGSLLVTEAGGCCSGYMGDFDVVKPSIVAGVGEIADELLGIINP